MKALPLKSLFGCKFCKYLESYITRSLVITMTTKPKEVSQSLSVVDLVMSTGVQN